MAQKDKLWCSNGKHHWYRKPKRGRKPVNCAEHPKPGVQVQADLPNARSAVARAVREEKAEVKRAEEAQKAKDMSHAHEAKRQKREQRKLDEIADLQQRADEALRLYEQHSSKAFKTKDAVAMKTEFDRSDAYMNRYLNVSSKIRRMDGT